MNEQENKNPQNKNHPLPGNQPNKQNNPLKRPKFSIYWLYIALFAIFIGMQFLHSGSQDIEINQSAFFYEMLEPGDVEKIIVKNEKTAYIYIKSDRIQDEKYLKYFKTGKEPKAGPQFSTTTGPVEVFAKKIEDVQKNLPEEDRILPLYTEDDNFWKELLSWVLPFVLLIALWMFLFRRMAEVLPAAETFLV